MCLENSRSSRMWLAAPLCRLGGLRTHTVFCAFGTPWRKATTFCTWHCVGMHALEATCSSKHGISDHSGLPHRILQGNASSSVPWTKVAEPYPRTMCREYAKIVRRQHMLLFQRSLDTLCNVSVQPAVVESNIPAERLLARSITPGSPQGRLPNNSSKATATQPALRSP